MKRTLHLLAAALLLATGTVSVAQETRPTLGFGLATIMRSSAIAAMNSPAMLIFVPIGLGKLRIEPQLGFLRSRSSFGETRTMTTVLVGAGALYEVARTPRTSVYAGGRLSFVHTKETFDSSSLGASGEGTALAVGGEYFPAPFVSLGAEAQAGVGATQSQGAQSAVTAETAGLLFVRFYLR